MTTYFNNTYAMDTDDFNIIKGFHTADCQPERFIRISMDEEAMLLNYKGRKEYEIRQATVFTWTSYDDVTCVDYTPQDSERYFYAALAENSGVIFRFCEPDCSYDGYHEFFSKKPIPEQGMFGAFKTDNGTILITYQGINKHIGFSFIPETPESSCAADQLMILFNHLLPKKEAEVETENE